MDGNFNDLLDEVDSYLGVPKEVKKPKIPVAPKTSTSPDWNKLKKGDDFHGFYVTSAFDGGHNEGSKHYSRQAIDLRTHNKTPQEVDEAIKRFQSMGYKVKDERQRPKGQKVWTGAHLHIENTGSSNPTPQTQKSVTPQNDYSDLLGQVDSYLGQNASVPPPIDNNLLSDIDSYLGTVPQTNDPAVPGTAEYNQQVVASGSKLPQILYPVTETTPIQPQTALPPVTPPAPNPMIVEPVQTLSVTQPETVPPVIEQPPKTETPELLYKQFLTDTGLPDSPESLAEFNTAQKLSVEGANAENLKAAETDQANMAAYNQERQKELDGYNAQRKQKPQAAEVAVSPGTPKSDSSSELRDTKIGIQVRKGESVRDAIRNQAIQTVSGRGYMATDVETALDKYGTVEGVDGYDDYQIEKEGRTVNLTITKEFLGAVEGAKKEREARQSAIKQIALERLRKGGELSDRDIKDLESEGISLKDIPAEEIEAARAKGQETESDRAKRFEGNKYATILRASELGEITAKETADMIAFQDKIEADLIKENTPDAFDLAVQTGGFKGAKTQGDVQRDAQKRIEEKLNEIRSRKKGGIPAMYRQREFEKKELEKFKKEYISGGGYNVPAQIAKSFTKGAMQVVTDVIQATDIAGETLGIDLYAQTVGDGRVRNAYERDSYKFAEYLNKRIEEDIADDPLLKDKAYLTSLPRTFGGLSVQILAGLATGGAAAPTLLGASQGVTGQYKEALEAGADPKHRQIAAVVGGLLAVPEALLFTKWFKGASLLKQRTFFGNMSRQVYLNLRNKGFIQKEAAEIATGVTKGFAQRVGAKAKEFTKDGGFEMFQETIIEGKGNDLVAYLTYDPSPERLKKATSLTGEDFETAVISFLAGGGGSLIVNQVKDSAKDADSFKSRIQGLDLSTEVKETLTEMVETGKAEARAGEIIEGVTNQKTDREIQVIKRKPEPSEDLTNKTVETRTGEQVIVKAETSNKKRVIVEDASGKVTTLGKNEIEVVEESFKQKAPVNPDNEFTFKVDVPKRKDAETNDPFNVEFGTKDETKQSDTPDIIQESSQTIKSEILPTDEAQGDVSAKVEEKPKHDFSSTQVNLPKAESEKVLSVGKNLVKDEDLAKTVDWNPREDKPHITVKYGLHTNKADDVRKILEKEKPFEVTLGKTSIFPAKKGADYDVVKVDIDSPELHRVNKLIADNTEVTDTHPTYQPHVTLAYIEAGKGKNYVGNSDLEGQKLTFNSIAFSDKDGNQIDIPLGGKTETPKDFEGLTRGEYAKKYKLPLGITKEDIAIGQEKIAKVREKFQAKKEAATKTETLAEAEKEYKVFPMGGTAGGKAYSVMNRKGEPVRAESGSIWQTKKKKEAEDKAQELNFTTSAKTIKKPDLEFGDRVILPNKTKAVFSKFIGEDKAEIISDGAYSRVKIEDLQIDDSPLKKVADTEGFRALPDIEGTVNEKGGFIPADKENPALATRRALRIPPAWKDVKISTDPNASVIATGRDLKGRPQSLYSAAHTSKALVNKFIRQREFNNALPKILEQIEADIQANSRFKEEATVLRLIALSGFRVGGSVDTKAKIKAYGASTLLAESVIIDGDTVHFDFIGKLGVRQQHSITDAALAKDLQARKDSGKERLFDTTDVRIRTYLKLISDKTFKVHDFRTWNASEAARFAITELPTPTTAEEFFDLRDMVGDIAARKIGDTRKIALETYVDPLVFTDWRIEAGVEENAERPKRTAKKQSGKTGGETQLSAEARTNERILRTDTSGQLSTELAGNREGGESRLLADDPSILKKTSADAKLQKELESAHLSDVIGGMNSRIVGEDLELTPHDSEFLRRAMREAFTQEESAFDGVLLRPKDFSRIVPVLNRVAADMNKAGYTKAEIAPVKSLINNLKKVARANQYTGALYAFEDALAEEKFHQEEFLAGGTDAKARDFIKQSDIWTVAQSGKFARDYGKLNDNDKISEIVAKLATDQAAKYGFNSVANFPRKRRELMKEWADGVLRNNKEVIEKDGLDTFLNRFQRVKKYAETKETIEKGSGKSTRTGNTPGSVEKKSDRVGNQSETVETRDIPSSAAAQESVEVEFEQNLKNRQYAETLRENGRNSYQTDVAYLPESEKAWSDNARRIIEESFAADPNNPFAQAIKEFNNKNQPESFRAVLGVALIDHTGAIGDYDAMREIADKTVEIVGTAGQTLRASQMVSKYDFAKGIEIATAGMKKLGNELTVPQIEDIKQKTGRYAKTAEDEAMLLSMVEEAKAELAFKDTQINELDAALTQVRESERAKTIALEEAKKQASIAKRLATFYKNKFNRENPIRRRAVGSSVLRKELALNKDADLDILRNAFSMPLKSVSASLLKSAADRLLTPEERAALVRQAQRKIVAETPASYKEVIKELTDLTGGRVSESTIKAIHAEAINGIRREKLDVEKMSVAERAEYEKAKANRKIRAEHQKEARNFEKYGETDNELNLLNKRIIKKIVDDEAIPEDEKEKLITATILLMKAPGAKSWHEGFADAYKGTRSENDKWFKRAYENRVAIKKEIKKEQVAKRAEKEEWKNSIADFEHKLTETQKAKRDAQRSLDGFYTELQKSNIEKIIDGILLVPDISRTLMSTGEVSQIGRQGYPTLLTFPQAWVKSLKGLQTGLGDPVKRFAYIKAIEETPRFKESVKYGMPYASFGENAVGDEHFPINRIINRFADRDYKAVDKIKPIGWSASKLAKLQQRFEKAYTDPADIQRFLSYSIMADLIDSQGLTDAESDKAKKRAVYYSQILSGKGSLPKFFGEKSIALRLMSSIGFAPNLLASRFETAFHFNPIVAMVLAPKGLKATTARRGLQLYAMPMILAVALSAIFKAGDSDDEEASYFDIINPKSKSFLKFSIRGTDINLDVSGGMSEFQRLMFWSWANLAYSAATDDLEGFTNTAETLAQNESNTFLSARFARAKLSPAASLGVDLVSGTDYLGHPINLEEGGYWGAITSRMSPITYQSIYDSLTYDENRSLVKEPKTADEAYKRLMRFNLWNIPTAAGLGVLQAVGITANQYAKGDKSIAEDTAWAMWENKYIAKDPRLNRVRTNLRNLFRKKLQLEKKGQDTKTVDALIEEIKEKYKDLPKKKLMEAAKQAKQGKFEFVTKSFDESQIKRIMQFATENEKKDLEKILEKKQKAKKKKK